MTFKYSLSFSYPRRDVNEHEGIDRKYQETLDHCHTAIVLDLEVKKWTQHLQQPHFHYMPGLQLNLQLSSPQHIDITLQPLTPCSPQHPLHPPNHMFTLTSPPSTPTIWSPQNPLHQQLPMLPKHPCPFTPTPCSPYPSPNHPCLRLPNHPPSPILHPMLTSTSHDKPPLERTSGLMFGWLFSFFFVPSENLPEMNQTWIFSSKYPQKTVFHKAWISN